MWFWPQCNNKKDSTVEKYSEKGGKNRKSAHKEYANE